MPDNLSIKNVSLTLYIFFTLIFGILWQGGEFFWFGLAGSSIVLLLIFHIHKYYSEPLLLPKSLINTTVLLFAAWCLLTVIWSVVPHISLIRAITIMAAPIGIYSYFLLTHSAFQWEKLWHIVLAVGVVLFIYSLIEVYLGISTPNSLFFNKNTHATYLNLLILPTTAYFLLAHNERSRLILGSILFLLIFSHALPGSRGATLGQFIGLGMLLIACRKQIPLSKLKPLLGIYISALGLATLITSNLVRLVEFKIEENNQGRWAIWEGAINLLKDTPWYGSGAGTYWLTYPAYAHYNDRSSGQNAHNDYLQYLIETGVPGFLILLALIFLILFYWFKTIKNQELDPSTKIESTAILGAITAVGFHAFFTFNFGVFSILFMTGLLFGRFFYLNNQTRIVTLSKLFPIRKKIFSMVCIAITIITLNYFASLSTFSQLYNRAALAYVNGDISKTDSLNSIALSIYSYDDRPYFLYAYVYEKILEKVHELSDQKKQYYFNLAMEYLDLAISKNAYRAKSYHLKARIIEKQHALSGDNWEYSVESLYLKSLSIKPKLASATLSLAEFYSQRNKKDKASELAIRQMKYWRPYTAETYKLYMKLYKYIKAGGNKDHLNLFELKRNRLVEGLELNGTNIEELKRETEEGV